MTFFDISGNAVLNGEYKEIKKEKDENIFLSISSYVNGILSGQSRKFDRSGILTAIITYENGIEIEKRENVNSSGYVEYIEDEVTQKRQEGKYIIYTEDEVKIIEYKNNKLQGEYYTYVIDKNNDKAILTTMGTYDNGYLYGIQTYFNSLGKAVLIETYEKYTNIPTKATWFEYYPGTESLRSEKNYIGSKINGTVTYYYENGKIKEQLNYKNGLLHGEATKYDENGAKTEYKYEFGSRVLTTTPDVL
ncbi:toxin-antitoxin system YwqK family antitoxin [Caviibacter abscessus]|uniref:toxin-antitoxin system YwqK family antitoxin n=1 Tax=Caviibacter abscessus TaxID=1766719 RepID=UPI0008346791|nr:hypothetical protein [Caviibacter abscessus]